MVVAPDCDCGVYPRVCGGSVYDEGATAWMEGLSPRVRGKRRPAAELTKLTRSIPACAGEAVRGASPAQRGKVYPRVCGGSGLARLIRTWNCGLSPRVRGKPDGGTVRWPLVWSIPACAGEAVAHRLRREVARVYPRVCGGSFTLPARAPAPQGLSPRVRGKLLNPVSPLSLERSIPACAGEALVMLMLFSAVEVYPRVCGGSSFTTLAVICPAGLSPRVRGKRWRLGATRLFQRSIPACAGEAFRRCWSHHALQVYPRVCGGSPFLICRGCGEPGLSPRVRGKLEKSQDSAASVRSIPACAGEATPSVRAIVPIWVYPRVCGGSR